MKKNRGHIFIIILFLVANPTTFYGQVNKKIQNNCTQVMSDVGYFWKLDSVGSNGLRLFAAQRFLDCSVDTVTKLDLVRQLGHPNQILKQFKADGEIYVYHLLDIRKMPKDFDGPLSCSYLGFLFDPKTGYLVSIKEGDIDL